MGKRKNIVEVKVIRKNLPLTLNVCLTKSHIWVSMDAKIAELQNIGAEFTVVREKHEIIVHGYEVIMFRTEDTVISGRLLGYQFKNIIGCVSREVRNNFRECM